jgi:hypothetical protein
MMYLHPPFYSFEGVPVFPDYDDPNTYYYLPNRPHLAVDEGRPAIRLLVYKTDLDELKPDEESVAGFLYFDTTLDWPEATLKKVARKIQDDQRLDRPPRLNPLLYKGGTVRLMFLDKMTTPPAPAGTGQPAGGAQPAGGTAGTAPSPDRWVIELESSNVPSLYGENRAIFSAVLTKQATQLMFDSFENFIPAGVVYDLTFVAMQRAFNVHVSADWSQVYHFLDQKFSLNLIFVQSDIENVVSEMIDKKIIKIEASLEGVGDEGMESEFNAVRKELQEFVLDKFFNPTVSPDKQSVGQSLPDGVISVLRSLRSLHYPSVGFSRRQIDVDEIRSIDIDYTVSRAVERKIAPQAHLSLFYEDFKLTKDQVVTIVNGADDFWKTVNFDIAANADFDTDGLFGVSVDVAYGADAVVAPPVASGAGAATVGTSGTSPVGSASGTTSLPGTGGPLGAGTVTGSTTVSVEPRVTWSALLTKATPRIKRSAWFDPVAGRQFAYRYKPLFVPGAIPGPIQELKSPWQTESGNVLVVSPGELYQKRRLELQLVKNFPADLFPQGQVEILYKDAVSGWTFHDSAVVDPTNPRTVFELRIPHDATPAIAYRCSFPNATGSQPPDWQTTDSDLVLIGDPRKNIFRVNILVAGDRSKIQELLLNFRYEDPVDGHTETRFLRLTKANINDPQEWVFSTSDPKQHRYSYSQILMDTDGNIVETGQVQEEKGTLPVGVIYAKRWEIRPEVIGPAFADNGLERIRLNLRYTDPANQLSLEKQQVFQQPGKGEAWPLELKDASVRSYTYEVGYVLKNGFERKSGAISSSDTFLMISSVPPQ